MGFSRQARSSLGAALLGSLIVAAPALSASDDASPIAKVPSTSTASGPGFDGLRQDFPGVLAAMQDTAAPAFQAIAADGRAVRRQRGELVWSSEPLVADGSPVQRALQIGEDGVARPANPLVSAELPLDAASSITVGEGSSSFSVVPLSADDGEHAVLGDGVLHTGKIGRAHV
jgi:hypothetical protein